MNETITHVLRILALAEQPENTSRLVSLKVETVRELLALAEPAECFADVDALMTALENAAYAYGAHAEECPRNGLVSGCRDCEQGRLNLEARRAQLRLAVAKEIEHGRT